MVNMEQSMGDILLVEDMGETVEGLELDLRARGAAVTRVPDCRRARFALKDEKWSLILFDLRLPEELGEEATLREGLQLIHDKQTGVFGPLNTLTPFCIITLQGSVVEAERFAESPGCLGFFSKNEDSRRLFRTLREQGLLKQHYFDDTEDQEVRRRIKFLVTERSLTLSTVTLEAPTWGKGWFELPLSEFRPAIRSRLVEGPLPVFVYGTANVATDSLFELAPAEFDEVAELVPGLRLMDGVEEDDRSDTEPGRAALSPDLAE